MRTERFSAVLLEGHKEAAVSVPFDPATRWGLPATRLLPGRHGHRVRGQLNGVAFESAVVSRSGGFFLLVDEALQASAKLTIGDAALVIMHPAGAAPRAPSAATTPARRRSRKVSP
jgi:hypothetical protein